MDDNKIILTDDEGKEQEFELIVTFDIEDRTYAILADENSDDAFPVRIEEENGDEAVLVPVEDDEEFEAVAEAYEALDLGEEDDEDDEE